MPYKDKDRQRAYNRNWWREHPGPFAGGPLSTDIVEVVRRLGPVSPAVIVEELGYSNTNSVGVQLHRLRALGRLSRLGYGKWVIAE